MTRQCSVRVDIRVLRAPILFIAVLTFLITFSAQAQQVGTGQPSAKSSVGSASADQVRILDSYGKLPLSFEANHGQADAQVKFLSRTNGYSLFLTGDEAVLTLRGSNTNTHPSKIAGRDHASPPGIAASITGGGGDRMLRMKLLNANLAAKATGIDELPGTSNYFIGNDPAKWRTNVRTYAKVKYEGIYSGIDLVYYGNQRQLEYDFVVAPGADPRRIALQLRGAKQIHLDGSGHLVLRMRDGEIRWHKPVAYQEKDGTRQEIAAHYAITDKNCVGFVVAQYDPRRTLYIDPLIYSTYLGGSGYESGKAIAVDGSGNAYVTGITASADFPITSGAFQTTPRGDVDLFVTKLNRTGSALVYSTYLGGSGSAYGGGDIAAGIAVDASGNAYVTGTTYSNDFPTTPGAFQTVCGGGSGLCGGVYAGGGDGFVTKLNPTGSALVYSSYLGGSSYDYGEGIAVDSAGDAYVTGGTLSTDFPITPDAFQTTIAGGGKGFVTKFNTGGSALIYSTFFGGTGINYNGRDRGYGIAVDNSGNAYVTGLTESKDFPTTPGAFQSACDGGGWNCSPNAFVTKFNPRGSGLVYSTFLGGADVDWGTGIAVDSSGNAYVTGTTYSRDFPVTSGGFQTTCGGSGNNYSNCWDAFVTEINPGGSGLVYSNYLGGSNDDWGINISVDSSGHAYVVGYTESTDFPTRYPLQTTIRGLSSFVTKVNTNGSTLVYSTSLGRILDLGYDYEGIYYMVAPTLGVAVDSSGNAYVTGNTSAADFPTANPLQPFLAGPTDAFVAKIRPGPSNITLSPLHLYLGSYPVGYTGTPQASTLMNASSEPFAITSISVTGSNSRDFAQTNNCGTSLPPGTSCSITVTFTPKATGNRSASVRIDTPDSQQTLLLTGFGKYPTYIAISSSPNPSVYTQPVTFTATVSSSGGSLPSAQESISFFEDSHLLGSATLDSGAAALTVRSLQAGLHTITAVYAGDAKFVGSTSPGLRQTVDTQDQSPTATTLLSNLNPSTYGQRVALTATVTSSGPVSPTGTVVFKWKYFTTTYTIGTATLNSAGVATLTRSNLNADPYPMIAVYLGDIKNGPSESPILNQLVKATTSAATLTSSVNPSTVGQAITFTANITSPTVLPSGPVTFKAGTTLLGTAQLSSGRAIFTTSTLPAGSTVVKVTYNGNSNIKGSSAAVTQLVQP